jgi:hypothetical protein
MAKRNAAIVTVRSGWISENGFAGLFKGAFATSTGNAMIEATDHSLSDYSFVEVQFYPAFLNGHWIRLFIPRAEVVSIIVLERAKDASLIGFKDGKLK